MFGKRKHDLQRKIVEIDGETIFAGEISQTELVFDFDKRWLNILWMIVIFGIITLIGRVFYLSVVRHGEYALSASGNTLREHVIIAPRGRIFSTDNVKLAYNMPNNSAVITARDVPNDESTRRDSSQMIAQVLHIPEEQVMEIFRTILADNKDRVIKEHLSHKETIAIESSYEVIPMLVAEKNTQRVYENGALYAHIIGYEGLIHQEEFVRHEGYLFTDRIGKAGLEFVYEDVLRGVHGSHHELVNSIGVTTKSIGRRPVVAGADIYTHIDAGLQEMIKNRLEKELVRAETNRATAIALDPRTGAVRALVSLPSYDNNAFARGIDSGTYSTLVTDHDRPLFNRAIAGVYPPGSTVKPVMAIAALEENIISSHRQIESRGGLQIGAFFFGDWRAHGFTDIRRAIAVSSDVYFYTIGGGYGDIKGLGIDRMKKWMTRFGYGSVSGIDLPSEAVGIYPDEAWKKEHIGERWYVGDSYNTSIGQGFMTATPLQVANTIVAIANGGTLYKPRVADYAIYPDGKRVMYEPEILQGTVASLSAIKVAQEGMRKTVTEGTAQYLKTLNVAVAGKTGTAQFGTEDKVHSWFVGYAPYNQPEIVVLVMTEGQTQDISSSTVPVARDVFKWLFDDKRVSSDEKDDTIEK